MQMEEAVIDKLISEYCDAKDGCGRYFPSSLLHLSFLPKVEFVTKATDGIYKMYELWFRLECLCAVGEVEKVKS